MSRMFARFKKRQIGSYIDLKSACERVKFFYRVDLDQKKQVLS